MSPVKHIGIVLEAVVVVALFSAGAFAVPIVYTFNLNLTSSPLTPQVVQGSVSVDRGRVFGFRHAHGRRQRLALARPGSPG